HPGPTRRESARRDGVVACIAARDRRDCQRVPTIRPGRIMAEIAYAPSVKPPWATLLVGGMQRVEIPSCATARRGRVLIHAAKLPDPYPAAWAMVPAHLRTAAQVTGGLVGACEITGCITYTDRDGFAADRTRHLNDPDWFRAPALYGFTVV